LAKELCRRFAGQETENQNGTGDQAGAKDKWGTGNGFFLEICLNMLLTSFKTKRNKKRRKERKEGRKEGRKERRK